MFKLNPSPEFWTTVHLTVPGVVERVAVEMLFAHKTADGIKDWIANARETGDADAVTGVVRNWRGIDAEYSEDAVRTLIQNYPASAAEILEQYLRELTASRRKN